MDLALLRMLVRDAVPSTLLGGQSGFASLSNVAQELGECGATAEAVGVLEREQPVFYGELRERFTETVAQALTLKTFNILLARHHFRRRSSALSSRPIGLVVDPSNTCQLACPGCVHSEKSEALGRFDWPNGTLTEDRFAQLLGTYGPHAVGVYFCDYGEPLLNLRTPQLIRRAKQHLLATKLSTSLSVKKLDADALVQSGLDFMVLSIDGATQGVYERFRRNGNLELVFSNIRKLVEAKRRLRSHTPALSWNFLAFEHNIQEIPEAARLARQLGVNQFRVVEPFDVTWDDPTIRVAEVQGEVKRLDWVSASNRPDNWNPFPDELAEETIATAFEKPWGEAAVDERAASSGHTCHWLYENMIMDARGRILPCCGAPQPNGELVFGQLEETGGDPFNSEKYQSARSHFAADGADQTTGIHCSKCEWDQEQVNIDAEEIDRYFRAADSAFFDRRSRQLLTEF